ncbi:MAG: hypothetical protein JWL77_2228 [Chthonomonadaceae bacterium]|nr:hypothetical protein [Chthonomonadaceae bacterium]
MNAYRSSHKARPLKQRFLEASMECIWFPARLLFELWIRLSPDYKQPDYEIPQQKAGSEAL